MHVLERTSRLVHRLLPSAEQHYWDKVLTHARSPAAARPIKLAVTSDNQDAARDLITATFSDPFSTSKALDTSKLGFPVEICQGTDDVVPDIRVVLTTSSGVSRPRPHEIAVFTGTGLSVDPARALASLESVRANPSLPNAIQAFQQEFTASGVSSLIGRLRFLVGEPESFLKKSAFVQIHAAVDACWDALHQLRQQLSKLRGASSDLQEQVEEHRAKAPLQVFGPADAKDADALVLALNHARSDLKPVLDSLTVWRLVNPIWRADDIRLLVDSAIDRVWCVDLEKQMIFQAGKLSLLQEEFQKAAASLVTTTDLNFLAPSQLLRNSLAQLASHPSYRLTPTSLTSAIQTRRTQIHNFPTVRLQLDGNKALRRIFGSLASGMTFSWLGWTGWLVESGPSFMALDSATSLGIGTLGALVGIRWAVGGWETAKSRWWDDYERVGKGLQKDLKNTLDQRMSNNVLVVAEAAASGLSDLIDKQNEELVELEEELRVVEQELASEKK